MKSERLYEGIGYIDEKWLALADEPQTARTRRHFIAYELKKLLGIRYLWVFLAALLLLNSALAWYTAGRTQAAQEPTQMIADFFAAYFENPAEYDAYYAKMQEFQEEQNALFREAMRNGEIDFEMETMPDIYSTDESYSDTRLFDKLYRTVEAAESYPQTLQAVIDRARSNLAEFSAMGIPEDSYTYQYQLRVIELYELARDQVKIEVEYTRGWDEYFDYDLVNVFLFIMLIMLGSLIFAQEKQSGFLPIIRTARFGRARTAAAKILTMILLSSLFTLLFIGTTWAVYGMRIGFSSPDNVLQALGSFTLSPYQITVGEYFLITVGVKLLTFSLFSTLILALSTLFYNYILIYLCGLGLFGLNYLLYTLKYINAGSPLKNLNFVAVSAVNPLFVRYRAINFFGAVWGYVPFMLTVFGILLAASAAICVILYVKGGREIRPAFIDAAVSAVMTRAAVLRSRLAHIAEGAVSRPRKRQKARTYSLSLFGAETFKTLISSRFLIVVILILCVKVWYSTDTNAAVRSYSDAVYKEYMTTLYGPLTEEKQAYLADERAMINETLAKQKTMQQAYIEETISFDEYRDYLSDYNYASSRSELLGVIENHARYLEEKKAQGLDGWFLYDTGWRKLFTGRADLFLYTAILLLLTGSFAAEYASKSSSGGFAQILRSTRNGRHSTFRAKLLSSGVIAGVLSILTGAIDLITIAVNYELPGLSAPLLSMQLFGSLTQTVTVGTYVVIFMLLRLAASLLMAMLVCALSELLCKYIPVLGCAVLMTLLPALCAAFGMTAADKISFLNLLAGTPLVLESFRVSLFGSGWAMLALWLSVAGIAVSAMLASARRMFVR